ncbi:MAG TPA: PAS domain-containing protein [Rhizomicrobium sp.]|jgi:hypothetical protein
MVGDKMVFGRSLHEPSAEFEYPTTFKDTPELPNTRALIELWESYEAQGGMRMGRDIPSRGIAKFLAHILIVEPIGDWEDSYVRLAGQILMLRFGRDVTGERGSQVFHDNLRGHQVLCGASRKAVATRKPFFVDSRVMRNGEELMRLESLNAPISGPNGEPGWMLGAMFLF